ncbi:hypothetical protein NDGK_02812 [Clostridiales bacterium CHKCI001]|nr:hypothetical protein NDGK_02812 [Clostridiales bacterium CHKCI001]
MFVNIGFGNFINSTQIISISRFDSAPMKRLVQNAKDRGMSIDATQGRKTKSVIVTLGGYVVLSALLPDTLAGRLPSSIGESIEQEIAIEQNGE